MELNDICVIGGGGFVGRHIVHLLAARGLRVRVPARDRERAKDLILLPTVDVIRADVHDDVMLADCIRGAGAVINLVGVLHDGRGKGAFAAAHVELTRKIIAACEANGVKRYLHMSALGADVNGPSRYQQSKGAAEALVRASKLEWTLFRPSVVFGPDDHFLNLFAKLQALTPVMFLAKAEARFQPVYVEDVAAAFVRAFDGRASIGGAFDLCGPRVYTLRELVKLSGTLSGHPRPVIGLGDALSYLQALALECLPVKLMSRDNLASMQIDNVSAAPFPFGIKPVSIEAAAPLWFGDANPRGRYQNYRGHAGRATQAPPSA
jgi:NADH dehydrogenase